MIQFHLNNETNLHQSTWHSTTSCPIQHGDRIMTIYCCDVTSPSVHSW